MTEPQPVTDEQLAAWKALAETARTEAWQFTSPILRDAVPALIAEVERMRAVVADRAAVVEECARRVEAPAVAELVEALEWYGENARLCRLIHSEGDAGRHALSEDGGKRARALLAKHASPRDAT